MKKLIFRFNEYFMSRYENESVLTRQKVMFLFYYEAFGMFIVITHFIIMYWLVADSDKSQLILAPFLLLMLLCINILLVKGKFYFAANFSIVANSLLMTLPVIRNTYLSPVDVYSMDFYFFSVIIVQAALFNRTSWIFAVSFFFLSVDAFSYLQIYQRVTGVELHVVSRGAISSGINILLICFFSIILKIITQNAVVRSEEESEININNFEKIKRLLDSVSKTSDVLADHSDMLTKSANEFIEESQTQAATIEEISSASEEVVGNMEQVATVMDGQYENIKILLQKMDELSSVTSDINVQIDNVNRSSGEITSMAENGGRVLQQMHAGMNKVVISSKEMLNIVSIISDVADRINLLSLNASIEAARAGIAGKGFAVVADEISRLGEETQSNMREINNLIQATGNEINNGLKSTEITVNSMTAIIEKINVIINEINSIAAKTSVQENISKLVNDESDSLSRKTDQIKLMMDEQQSALNEIVKAIVSINGITQSYVEGSRKLYGNAEKVEHLALELQREVVQQN